MAHFILVLIPNIAALLHSHLVPCYPDYRRNATGSRNESKSHMAPASLPSAPLRVADLSQNSETPFDLRPNAAELALIAQDMDLLGLRKLSFQGAVRALGNSDWELNGILGVTVIQPCVITLDPVTTRIDVPVRRQFIKAVEFSDEPEVRIQKYLSRAGVASRREAERLVLQGRVRINGKLVLALGSKVLPGKDQVEIHGEQRRRTSPRSGLLAQPQ